MSDDPEQIRALARHAARLAADARAVSSRVIGGSFVRWHSQGADRYRRKLSDRAAEFRRRADDFEELSRLLYAHARHVEDHEHALNTLHDVARHALPSGWLP